MVGDIIKMLELYTKNISLFSCFCLSKKGSSKPTDAQYINTSSS